MPPEDLVRLFCRVRAVHVRDQRGDARSHHDHGVITIT